MHVYVWIKLHYVVSSIKSIFFFVNSALLMQLCNNYNNDNNHNNNTKSMSAFVYLCAKNAQ